MSLCSFGDCRRRSVMVGVVSLILLLFASLPVAGEEVPPLFFAKATGGLSPLLSVGLGVRLNRLQFEAGYANDGTISGGSTSTLLDVKSPVYQIAVAYVLPLPVKGRAIAGSVDPAWVEPKVYFGLGYFLQRFSAKLAPPPGYVYWGSGVTEESFGGPVFLAGVLYPITQKVALVGETGYVDGYGRRVSYSDPDQNNWETVKIESMEGLRVNAGVLFRF